MAHLLTFTQPVANSDSQRKQIFRQAPHSGALAVAAPGRILNEGIAFVAWALRSAVNRLAHRFHGLGPRAVAHKIRSLLQTTGQEGAARSLNPLQQKELSKYCSKLLKYALPSETATSQRRAFQHIVELVTLFPGVRALLLDSKHLCGAPDQSPSLDSIAAAWYRPAGESESMNEKWKFWCTLAATCLTETRFSVILGTSGSGQNCGLDVIQPLLVEQNHEGVANLFATALCVRYLGGILTFPAFWLKVGASTEDAHANHVGKRLCSWTVDLLEDLGVDNSDLVQPTAYFDYAGVDSLAHRVCVEMSARLQLLDEVSRPHQLCYESFARLVQFLRLPRCAQLLPESYTHAFSNDLRALVPVVLGDGQVDILVETHNSDGGSHRTISILESDIDIEGSNLELPGGTNSGQPVQELDDNQDIPGRDSWSSRSPERNRESSDGGSQGTISSLEDIEASDFRDLGDDNEPANGLQPVQELDDNRGAPESDNALVSCIPVMTSEATQNNEGEGTPTNDSVSESSDTAQDDSIPAMTQSAVVNVTNINIVPTTIETMANVLDNQDKNSLQKAPKIQTADGPRKKALLIAISKTQDGYEEIPEAHKDVRDMRKLIMGPKYGYLDDDISMLVDDGVAGGKQPTRANMLAAIAQFVKDVKAGDRLLFYYSGRAMLVNDSGPNREDARIDSSGLIPLDGKAMKIVNNELHNALVLPLPAGCTIVAILDTSHAASLLALKHYRCNRVPVPWVHQEKRDSNIRNGIGEEDVPTTDLIFGEEYYVRSESPVQEHSCDGWCRNLKYGPGWEQEEVRADVILLAACKHSQEAWDDVNGMTVSSMLIDYMKHSSNSTLKDVLVHMSYGVHSMALERHKAAGSYKQQMKNFTTHLMNRLKQLEKRGSSAVAEAQRRLNEAPHLYAQSQVDMHGFPSPELVSPRPLDMARPWIM
ncbi:caspase domain-containing protein [Roridomyces roridus]|uniref:Caspase domain-containing protein n=1 Tax=Roridomyces roridus TaxID=1738132 RepID=A0AAD7B4A4_9AGAR|nr:caspase domain-containing protein [Roridomyces roridus]